MSRRVSIGGSPFSRTLLGLMAFSVSACGGYAARPLSVPALLEEMHAQHAPAPVGQTAVLTEDEAVRLAAASAPELTAGSAAVRAAEAGARAARGWPSSEIRLNDLGWQQGDDALEKFHVALRWHVPNPFSFGSEIDAADALVPAARAEHDAQALDVTWETRKAYADVVAEKARVKIAAQAVVIAQESAVRTGEAVERGVVQPWQTAEAEVVLLDVTDALHKAETRRDKARRKLAQRVGHLDSSPVEPNSDAALVCPALPADDTILEQRLVDGHPAVRSARARYDSAEARLDAAYGQRIPFLGYIQGAYEYEPNTSVDGFQFSLSIKLPFGEWNGGRVALEEAHREMSAVAFRETLYGSLDEAQDALLAWREARARLIRLREQLLPALASAREQMENAVAAGSTTDMELLQAQRRELRGREAELDALRDCHEAWLRTEHAVGGSLPASGEANAVTPQITTFASGTKQ